MLNVQATILNKLGLHARASSKLVMLANKFTADITISYGNKSANAKSLMGVMMLAIKHGVKVGFNITGSDEMIAAQDILQLINDHLGEAE